MRGACGSWSSRSIALALLACALGAVQLPAAAYAQLTIDVFPGRNAIQKAIQGNRTKHNGSYCGTGDLPNPFAAC